MGALAVIQRFDRAWLVAHPEIQASVRQRAWTGTTVVAREFIVHALAGHFAESVVGLLEADSVEAARAGAARLLGAGATSRSDTLLGMDHGVPFGGKNATVRSASQRCAR